MLRLMGIDVTAKGNTTGSKLEYLSRGYNCWEVWKNADGTPATYTKINDWLASKKYKQMTQKRWLEFSTKLVRRRVCMVSVLAGSLAADT